jgi:hypothetical protein
MLNNLKTLYLPVIVLFSFFIFFIQPVNAQTAEIICPGGQVVVTAANDSGIVYQWQVNTGKGFTDLTDGAHYSGSGIFSMQIIDAPTSWYGYQYRCVVDGVTDTALFILQFATTWTGITDNWSDTRNWSCGQIPDSNTDVILEPLGDLIIVDINAFCHSLTVNPNSSVSIDPGITLKITH